MDLIKSLSALFGTFWLAWVAYMMIDAPSTLEEVAPGLEADMRESVEKVEALRCQEARDTYDRLWEASIERGDSEAMDKALYRAELAVEALCE